MVYAHTRLDLSGSAYIALSRVNVIPQSPDTSKLSEIRKYPILLGFGLLIQLRGQYRKQ
jgi:hypothetical protein